MGAGAETLAAALNAVGIRAESLPMPDQEALALGRRYTSGKECVPMTLTLGSLLQRIERDRDTDQQFTFFMPTANGPCRFGSYATLHSIVLERLGWDDRVGVWSPVDEDYFESVPDGFAGLIFACLSASDMLLAGMYDARPVERSPGAAFEVWEFYHRELIELALEAGQGKLTNGAVIAQTFSGHLFGVPDLLRRAARAFNEIKEERELPTVLVVGEIYVRCDPFANNFVIDKLEQRGIRCRFAAFAEWLEYTDYQDAFGRTLPGHVTSFIQASIHNQVYAALANPMGWERRTTVQDSLAAAAPYLRQQLSGEAVLTLGGPVHEWREGHIDGVVSVGPLECMPNKVSESMFYHVAEREGLHSLTLYLNGDPVDPEVLDNFAYEVHAQFAKRKQGHTIPPPPARPRPPLWRSASKVNTHEP
jgi:predicted nucleotide-binding protein (sugar kinase/HSP70/actin superfamily)